MMFLFDFFAGEVDSSLLLDGLILTRTLKGSIIQSFMIIEIILYLRIILINRLELFLYSTSKISYDILIKVFVILTYFFNYSFI